MRGPGRVETRGGSCSRCGEERPPPRQGPPRGPGTCGGRRCCGLGGGGRQGVVGREDLGRWLIFLPLRGQLPRQVPGGNALERGGPGPLWRCAQQLGFRAHARDTAHSPPSQRVRLSSYLSVPSWQRAHARPGCQPPPMGAGEPSPPKRELHPGRPSLPLPLLTRFCAGPGPVAGR